VNESSLFSTDLEKLTIEQVEEFCGLKMTPDNRVKEGPRVDYKQEFPQDLGKLISAFANTSGGLILIGVREEQGVPIAIEGVELGGNDIKTQITNIANSTIDPPLIPEVGICFTKAEKSKGVVLVRVPMSHKAPHMYTKSGANRICIRINDSIANADLQTIEGLYQRKTHALEEFRAKLFGKQDFVGLTNFQNGFRTLLIMPELPSECTIPFNRTTDLYFKQTKPTDIWGDIIRDRDNIAFVGQNAEGEQRFSIEQGGIIHYADAIEKSEQVYIGNRYQAAILLYRIECILKMVLPYAREVFKKFGYLGDVHIVYRLGRIKDKYLASEHKLPLSPAGRDISARRDEISIERRLALDDIEQRLDAVITSVLEELCRGAFGFNFENQWR